MVLSNQETQDILGQIVDAAGEIAKVDKETEAFVELLYAGGTPEELNQYEREELAEVALSAFSFINKRKVGQPKVRISNPEITARSEYGLEAPISAIEIVNDNMPFLVDSVMGELQERGLAVHLALHPILNVKRNKSGRLSGPVVGGEGEPGSARESLIEIHVDRIDRDSERQEIVEALERVLTDVRLVVSDWKQMRERLDQVIKGFKSSPPPIPVDEIAEGIHFLLWLMDDNFTFLGMREYHFDNENPEGRFQQIEDTGLGILSNPEQKVLRRGSELVTFTPELREFLMQPVPLIITKANVRSLVHRRMHMDYIGLKRYSEDGILSGELRIVGLFTSTAYTRSTKIIPYLRRKVDHVRRQAGFAADSHSGKALQNVLEQYPRDELFQIDPTILTEFSLSILQLNDHPRIRVLTRVDRFDRFVSVLVYVPKDRYNTDVRQQIGAYLAEVYDGRVSAFYPSFPDGSLTRVHYIIGRYEGETPKPGQGKLEAEIGKLIQTWDDRLRFSIASGGNPKRIRDRQRMFQGAFTLGYQEAFVGDPVLHDIEVIERLSKDNPLEVIFYQHDDEPAKNKLQLKLYRPGDPIPLSERVPVLENMGFKVINERSYIISPAESEPVSLHDMALQTSDGSNVDLEKVGTALRDCFASIWSGYIEDDGYNSLVLRAGLEWNEVNVLRAYSRYLRQARIPFSQDYMWETLNRHSSIAANLVNLFSTRFSTSLEIDEKSRTKKCEVIQNDFEKALESVDSLDEDRIIRRFVNLIMVTLRTNFYQRDKHGKRRPTIALKLDSSAVEELPAPRPFREIFIYSPRVEGVHLRFGKVARGGLRWSDRPQDFRTEVLGLVKAQQVKNAVIVPVGAKGGFIPKFLPTNGTRDEIMAEGIAAYKIFVGTMLDITDNLDGDVVVHPRSVIRYDEDDPYLVVAADKGTATFSDVANELSDSRDFWLSDAFASGGSVGYDHKKMGITARGGWEAVKRHFREMDRDIQTTPVTVIGVGDMSGDVFGNGMLLSKQIKLIGAFDHRDIFIDPDPDPKKSFKERQRLFDLPRSSWADYNTKLISKGGGIFSRREKSISLSAKMKAILGLRKATATPNEIINALLKAEADLLWFGGIGTYVRAVTESDEEVGDRSSDAYRVTSDELRVKVVGEGANLGMTQKARIEFALRGGRVNSDAIDNSAGVNSSDLEVNIKIALGKTLREDRIKQPARNRLLASMTEEVGELVLRNNYLQTLSLSLAECRGMQDFGFQVRLIQDLESRGLLDREVEDLPDDLVLMEREKAGRQFPRPELAVLLAYAKLTLYDQLLASLVPDDEYLAAELIRYFPKELQKKFPGDIASHRLRREIIATMLANSMINRGGSTFVHRISDQTGADVGAISAAYAAVRDSFSMGALNEAIDELDNKISGALQIELYIAVQTLLRDQIIWFLRNIPEDSGIGVVVEQYRAGIETLQKGLSKVVPKDRLEYFMRKVHELENLGIPSSLATNIASLNILADGPDIVLVSQRTGKGVNVVAKVFFAVAELFDAATLVRQARELEISDYFDRLALTRTLETIAEALRQITAEALGSGKSGNSAVDSWVKGREIDVERTQKALAEIVGAGDLTLSKLTVGASMLSDLTDS